MAAETVTADAPRPMAAHWLDETTPEHASQRWPALFARWLPRWKERAPALGIKHESSSSHDSFIGERAALVALGIAGDGDFPGDAGRGRCMVTFARDGRPKRRGESVRLAAVCLLKRGADRYEVQVFAPHEVSRDRVEHGSGNARVNEGIAELTRIYRLTGWTARARLLTLAAELLEAQQREDAGGVPAQAPQCTRPWLRLVHSA